MRQLSWREGASSGLAPPTPLLRSYLRAIVSLWASQLFWVGIWNVLTIQLSLQDRRTFELFPDTPYREAGYVLVGLALLLLTDTLYGLGGLHGGLWPPAPGLHTRWVLVPRVLVGLLGGALVFVGLYDLVDIYMLRRCVLRDGLCVSR